jgi:hypothetical protein
MSLISRRIKYVAINGAFAAALWFGIVEGVDGAANLAMAWAWFLAVVSLCVSDDAIAKTRNRFPTPAIPETINVAYDLAIIGFMFWHDWMVTGGSYALHMIMMAGARQKIWGRRALRNTDGTAP